MIDLHTHSTFSDGSLTPAELVEHAARIGLTTLALTDHDSTGGIDSFLAACGDGQSAPLVGISGVEISADVGHGTMHMLGYFIDHTNETLAGALARIRDGRRVRNLAIVAKLNELGLDLEMDEVQAFAGEDVVGRPHFAKAMEARGFVTSKLDAFKLYLAKGGPAYVDRFRFSPEESIGVIVAAGGVPVLSHPLTLDLDKEPLRQYVEELCGHGLQGIEAYYPEHSQSLVKQYLTLAREFDLVVTGGSDFHGEANKAIRLGSGFGSLNVPDELVEPLRMRAAALGGKTDNETGALGEEPA